MKNIKFGFKKNIRLMSIVILIVTLLSTSLFAILSFGKSKNAYADATENTTGNTDVAGLLNEKPENFEPQLTLNKYAGAENSFNEQTNELIIDFPVAYTQEHMTIAASDWEKDKLGNYSLVSDMEDNTVSLKIENSSANDATLLLEKEEQDDNICSSFRMVANVELVNYVEKNAKKTDGICTTVEDMLSFTDAQVITYSVSGEEQYTYYNKADESWRDFSDEQIDRLFNMTSSRENKLKLEMIALKINNNQDRFGSKDGSSHITDYIPDFVFTYVGKSVFIGQEYGFLITVKDNKRLERINSETGQVEYYTYDNSGKETAYHFNENNCALEISLMMFSIDRHLYGREYYCNVKLLFNIGGSFSRGEGNTYYAFYKLRDNICFMADPSMGLSVNNLYDLNEFDEGYNEEGNGEIGISQVRMNFTGYAGEKIEKKYRNAKEIASFIYGVGKDVYNIGNSVRKIARIESILEKLSKLTNFVGTAAGFLMDLNPYLAAAHAIIDLGEIYYEYLDDKTLVFQDVSANNESNILTFPAPSEGLVKSAVASFGVDYNPANLQGDKLKEEKVEAIKNIICNDKAIAPKFVMGEYMHYVQAVFMLSELNKPTALTSYINPAFAVDKTVIASNVVKFLIPEKFNYSEKMSRICDDGYNQLIRENNVDNVSYFGSDSRNIQLSVSENGVYDFCLKDLVYLLKNEEKTLNVAGYSNNSYLPLKMKNGFEQKDFVKLFKNGYQCGEYIDMNYDGFFDCIRLDLSAEEDNIFELYICDDGFSSDEASSKCLGATFTADLHKHYDVITPSDEAQECNFNDKSVTYTLLNQGTGLYNITVNNAEFDLYSYDFKLLNQGQKSMDVFMIEQENYYIRIKKDSGIPTITFSPVTESLTFDSGNNFDLDISLSKSENTKIRRLFIARTGIYTFDYAKGNDAGYTLQVKDKCFVERLFGAKKAYLDAGEYYLLFKSSETTIEDNLSISFTPQTITLEKEVLLSSDAYYTFVPPQDGLYTFNLTGHHYVVTVDNNSPNAQNRFELTAGQKHIVHLTRNNNIAGKYYLTVEYSPVETATYNKTFYNEVVEFKTDITGYYSFNGGNIALYNKYLTLISDGNGGNFTCSLVAGEKYFIIKSQEGGSEIVLEGEKITANFEATIMVGNHYLMFTAPEDGYYKVRARYSGISELKVYAYDKLNIHEAVLGTEDGYYLYEGCVYYIKLNLTTTDRITVINGNITVLPEIPEGTLSEVNLSRETNYASSYKFVPSDTGKYTFIFSSDLSSEFTIYISGESFALSRGSNVLKITKTLIKGNTYEIKFNLTSGDYATLIFGVYRQIEDFVVKVSDRQQDDCGLVNKIAVGADIDDVVHEQISIVTIYGSSAYTKVNFEILNTPIVEGEYGVKVDAGGYITVSNKLPQWTAFAVEVNIGRVKYGDLILDNGLTKVINFLIYVDVQDIQIFDENDKVVFSIDVAPKQTINLTAKVFPYHAAQANTLNYEIGEEGRKYVDLETDGVNAIISGKFTTPNNTYVKIEVKCADEFTAVVMVRVHAEIINIYNENDFKLNESDETKTAYELVLYTDVASAEIKIPSHITYLKIRQGTKKRLINSVISVNSSDLTLVLESVEITGQYCGAINASHYKLDIYFVGTVTICGKSGDYVDISGYSAICAKELNIYNAFDSSVYIIGGDGFSITEHINDENFTGNGGDGGDAMDVSQCVNLYSVNNLRITGGNGGRGMDGQDADSVYNPYPSQAAPAKNGTPGTTALFSGERGGYGGNGGLGIKCESLFISNSQNTLICGGHGGNAGDGGDGADGGNGGKGGNTNGSNAGNGGKGGKGSNGGQGGDGGNGAAAVIGKVTIVNSQPKFKAGDGGNGGRGGAGGNGGRGGDGGDDVSYRGHEAIGGDGGDGGNAGAGGSAGKKGKNVEVSQIEVNLVASDGEDGKIGYKGYGGEGGDRGDVGGYNAEVEVKANPGKDGEGEERI